MKQHWRALDDPGFRADVQKLSADFATSLRDEIRPMSRVRMWCALSVYATDMAGRYLQACCGGKLTTPALWRAFEEVQAYCRAGDAFYGDDLQQALGALQDVMEAEPDDDDKRSTASMGH